MAKRRKDVAATCTARGAQGSHRARRRRRSLRAHGAHFPGRQARPARARDASSAASRRRRSCASTIRACRAATASSSRPKSASSCATWRRPTAPCSTACACRPPSCGRGWCSRSARRGCASPWTPRSTPRSSASRRRCRGCAPRSRAWPWCRCRCSCSARPAPARSWWRARCTIRAGGAAASCPSTAARCPRSSIESEMFGHERGAFTGAETAAQGFLPGGRRRHAVPRRDRRAARGAADAPSARARERRGAARRLDARARGQRARRRGDARRPRARGRARALSRRPLLSAERGVGAHAALAHAPIGHSAARRAHPRRRGGARPSLPPLGRRDGRAHGALVAGQRARAARTCCGARPRSARASSSRAICALGDGGARRRRRRGHDLRADLRADRARDPVAHGASLRRQPARGRAASSTSRARRLNDKLRRYRIEPKELSKPPPRAKASKTDER